VSHPTPTLLGGLAVDTLPPQHLLADLQEQLPAPLDDPDQPVAAVAGPAAQQVGRGRTVVVAAEAARRAVLVGRGGLWQISQTSPWASIWVRAATTSRFVACATSAFCI
jgi:hypothetical protein